MKSQASLLIALMSLLSGCRSYPTYTDIQRQLQAQLQTVNTEDGISIQEANTIAQSYFIQFGPGCGAAADVIDGNEFWISKTYVGYAAVETAEPIRIDKKCGRVTWGKGPRIEDPRTIFSDPRRFDK